MSHNPSTPAHGKRWGKIDPLVAVLIAIALLCCLYGGAAATVIWALNGLFGLGIPLTAKTIACGTVLIAALEAIFDGR